MTKYISSKAKQKQYVQRAGNHLRCLQSSSTLRNLSANWERAGSGFAYPAAGVKLAAEIDYQDQTQLGTSLKWQVSCDLA